MDVIFLPGVVIFLPMILKWLFFKDFGLEYFIMIIYSMWCENMDDSGQLYHQKLWISKFINGKWNENGLKIGIAHSDFNVEKICVWSLLQRIFNQLLHILIINQRMFIKCAQKLSRLIQSYFTDIAVTAIKRASINNHCHSQSNHKQSAFTLICDTFINFDSNSYSTMFNLFKMVDQDNNFPRYHINIVIRNTIPSSVCVANIVVTKLCTNIALTMPITIHRWSKLYYLVMILIYLTFEAPVMLYDTSIINYESIMLLNCVVKVMVHPNGKHLMLLGISKVLTQV